MTSKTTIMPRDLQPGDVVTKMTRDLAFVDVPVEHVEKVRAGKRTAYRVHLDVATLPEDLQDRPEFRPFILQPGAPIDVIRGEAS